MNLVIMIKYIYEKTFFIYLYAESLKLDVYVIPS